MTDARKTGFVGRVRALGLEGPSEQAIRLVATVAEAARSFGAHRDLPWLMM